MEIAQRDWSVTNSDQAADGDTQRFEHAPDLTVTALVQCYAIPDIDSRPAVLTNLIEFCDAVVEFDTPLKLSQLFVRKFAHEPYRVLARDFVARVHQAMGQLTVGGQ